MNASAPIERAPDGEGFPIRHGVFVAVAGPSGAGKDTLLCLARRHFGDDPGEVVFVRRVVTRPADAAIEDHDSLGEAAFEAARAAGRFAVAWRAHGFGYALPADTDDIVRSGRVAVANVSRAAIDDLAARYANVAVVIVTAPPEVLAGRLAARGRETREEALARLARAPAVAGTDGNVTVIDNSGAPEEAGERLVAALRRAVAWAAVCDTV